MTQVYLKDKHAVAYFHEQATADFWDEHWKSEDLRRDIVSCKSDPVFMPLVKKFLPSGSTVLDGGCGRGHLVYALGQKGYRAIGVDFAKNTVQQINQVVPELDIRFGDVRKLEIDNDSLDGYISVGVIEHFWDGYDAILAETQRTLKPNGFLFISFPHLSLLRQLKVMVRGYPVREANMLNHENGQFYQFALRGQTVIHDLKQCGFILREKKSFDGLKGFKDELPWFRPWLQPIYDGNVKRKLRQRLDTLFRPFASHCMLLVMQKIVRQETNI